MCFDCWSKGRAKGTRVLYWEYSVGQVFCICTLYCHLFGAWYEALEHTKYTSAYLPNLSNAPLGVAQVVGSVWRPVGTAQGMCCEIQNKIQNKIQILEKFTVEKLQ